MLGIPAYRDFPAATVISLFDTVQLCERSGVELVLCTISDCSVGAFAARNLVAREFLKSDCSHLFFVDADMVWGASDFSLLLGMDLPFVAVPGPKKQEPTKLAMVRGMPGLCFACVRRDVMEAIASAKEQIFNCGQMGEDYMFCKDIETLGFTINIVKDIQLGHIGTKEYRI